VSSEKSEPKKSEAAFPENMMDFLEQFAADESLSGIFVQGSMA